MQYLPPIKITRGEPFAYAATVVGQDWTGWTGTVIFRRNRQIYRVHYEILGNEVDPILTETVTGDAAGEVQFSLTATQTLLFPALQRIGFFAQGKFEISMTNGADVQKFQGRFSTAETLA